MLYVLGIVIFLLIWIVLSSILILLFNKEKSIDKLKYVEDEFILKENIEQEKKKRNNIIKILAALIPEKAIGVKRGKRLELELIKADIPITIEELLVIKILFSSAFSFLTYAVFKNVFIVAVIFILVWNIPNIVIGNRKKARIKQFDLQLNEGIMIISNSLKAGYSFLQAVAVVVEETKAPFSKEFKKLLKEMSLGIPEEDALKNLLLRMESDDLKLIINAILIQKDIGGNLSEILDNIGDTIRERQKIQSELKTLTAQGRLSGMIVMMIPIFLGIIIYMFNKEYMILLFTNPMGIAMVAAAVFNQILGFFMIRKIINIDM